MIAGTPSQARFSRDVLMKPFTAKLSSALDGSRLVRSLLEMIASQAAGSLRELAVFVRNTLKYQLAKPEPCAACTGEVLFLQDLLGESPP